MTFPDEPNLRRVAEALWAAPPEGRAAVMVGSGLSRNAVRRTPAVDGGNEFPDWSALTRAMALELYTGPDERPQLERALLQSGSISGALRIADEYEAARGRGNLDRLLSRVIPDDEFLPGRLHELLCRLPWADVLTTNFDTLIERAALQALDRRYRLVRSQADIPGATRPRIVKLHGSFPDSTPFVITEDDFRTFEVDSAAMVNLAKQCFVENVCCLVGFSGDDPNFLRWTGWVRDVLGPSHMEPVYVVGLLEYSPARRALLERRYVRTIDLSPLFPGKDWPDGSRRHAAALEWFFRSLENLRPPDLSEWPNRLEHAVAPTAFPDAAMPAPLARGREGPLWEHDFPTHMVLGDEDHADDDDMARRSSLGQAESAWRDLRWMQARNEGAARIRRIDATVETWERNRSLYPGWLVLPFPNWETLVAQTLEWVDPIVAASAEVEPSKAAAWIDALNWRLERCLVPWCAGLTAAAADVLERLHPATPVVGSPVADRSGAAGVDPGAVDRIGLRLMRSFRELGDMRAFDAWYERLSDGRTDAPGRRSFLAYQRALSLLERWRMFESVGLLLAWDPAGEDPIWRARRAVLLAEVDRPEAKGEARLALKDLQAMPSGGDLAVRTREACVVRLVAMLDSRGSSDRLELDQRSRTLKAAYAVDVTSIWERVRSRISRSPPGDRAGPSGRDWAEDPVLMAGIAGRFVEESAMPTRFRSTSAAAHVLADAAAWLSARSPDRALLTSVRCRRSSWGNPLGTHRLARVSSALVVEILGGALETLARAAELLRACASGKQYASIADGLDEHVPAEGLNAAIRGALDVVKGLMPVLDDDRIAEAAVATLAVRKSWTGGQWQTFSAIDEACGQLLHACDVPTIARLLPDILAQPIVGIDVLNVPLLRRPDALARAAMRDGGRASEDLRTRASDPIDRLFALTEDRDDPDTLARATMRIALAQRWDLLTVGQAGRFADLFGRRVGPTHPSADRGPWSPFRASDLLLMPHPSGAAADPRLSRTTMAVTLVGGISAAPWTSLTARTEDGRITVSMGPDLDNPLSMALEVTSKPWIEPTWNLAASDWGRDAVLRILAAARAWLSEEGLDLADRSAPGWHEDEPHPRLANLVQFCASIALPAHPRDGEIVRSAAECLAMVRGKGLAIDVGLPVLVSAGLMSEEEAADELRRAASSLVPERSMGFLTGTLTWLAVARIAGVAGPPEDLISEIAVAVRGRRAPDLLWALQVARIVLTEFASQVPNGFRRDLEVGLRYLAYETDIADPSLGVAAQSGSLEEIRSASVELVTTLLDEAPYSSLADEWLRRAEAETVREVRHAYGRFKAQVAATGAVDP